MKNLKATAMLLVMVMMIGMLSGCGTQTAATTTAETTTAEEKATGTYTLYNVTGEAINELYLYETGSEKGENLAADGFRNNKKMVVTYDGTANTTLTLEYTIASGVTGKFETLHIEEVPIALNAVDATSGATPISFSVPEDTGNYKLVNTTGTVITELYVYPTDGSDKGENLAKTGLADGEFVEVSFTGPVDTALTIEFTTEADGAKSFTTLHIETVTINLLAADGMTGATPISFGY